MIEDGKDPVRQDLTKHIVPSMENASVIAQFFQGAEPKRVKKALKGMIQNNHLLLAPSRLKKSVDLCHTPSVWKLQRNAWIAGKF